MFGYLSIYFSRKGNCFRNSEETTTLQPEKEELSSVTYRKNHERKCNVEVGVSTPQPVIGDNGYTEYKKNYARETYDHLGKTDALGLEINDETCEEHRYSIPHINGHAVDEQQDQLKSTYMNQSELGLQGDGESVYATIPDKLDTNEDGEETEDCTYSDTADHVATDTVSGTNVMKENIITEYINADFMGK